MNVKKLLSIAGLGLFAAVSVGAGLGLSQKKAEAVKAEGEWMFRVQFSSDTAGDWTGEDAISNVRFHYWGTGVDATVNLGPCAIYRFSGALVYGTNIVLSSTQTVTGGQFIFDQAGKSQYDCYSLNLSNCEFSAEDTSNRVREWYYYDTPWTEEGGKYKWHTMYSGSTDAPVVMMTSMANLAFTPNPSKNRWEAKNWVFEEVVGKTLNDRYLKFDLGASQYSISMLTDETKAEFGTDGSDYSACWYRLPAYGTHDFFLEAKSSGNGQMTIKKHTDADDTYIYYVTNSASATGDYIYSWGGEEQFGEFPGTSIASLVAADEAEEVTGNGVVHFQGGDTAKLIYRINITKGYPTGDTMFMFDGGTDEYKSDEREIVNENVYWWTGPANSDAKQGLEFIILLESYRNGVEDSSVCNIGETNAKFLVDRYNDQDAFVRETYIDKTTVYTWADASKSGNTLVTVRAIIERLGIIGDVDPAGSTGRIDIYTNNNSTDSSVLITVVSIIAIVSISSVAVLVIVKRRKHN